MPCSSLFPLLSPVDFVQIQFTTSFISAPLHMPFVFTLVLSFNLLVPLFLKGAQTTVIWFSLESCLFEHWLMETYLLEEGSEVMTHSGSARGI